MTTGKYDFLAIKRMFCHDIRIDVAKINVSPLTQKFYGSIKFKATLEISHLSLGIVQLCAHANSFRQI